MSPHLGADATPAGTEKEGCALSAASVTTGWRCLYHYYACSGRQKLGRKGCVGERIPRDKLEAAVLHQLAALYRDGTLIRDALERAKAKAQQAQPVLAEQLHAITEDARRAKRALARYYTAFESGELGA